MAEVFLDTNVLLYAALGGAQEAAKKAAARRIVLEENYVTSAQVLAEFYVSAVRKGAPPMSPDKARAWLVQIARKPCAPITPQLVQDAIALSSRYKISYWDGAIIAAAERLGAKTLYSEDLAHGATYGSVSVINPFLDL